MSENRYAPYGADNDPYLMHPARPAQAHNHTGARDYWDTDAIPSMDDPRVGPRDGQSGYVPSYAAFDLDAAAPAAAAFVPQSAAYPQHSLRAPQPLGSGRAAPPHLAPPLSAPPPLSAQSRPAQTAAQTHSRGNFRPRMAAASEVYGHYMHTGQTANRPVPNSRIDPQIAAPPKRKLTAQDLFGPLDDQARAAERYGHQSYPQDAAYAPMAPQNDPYGQAIPLQYLAQKTPQIIQYAGALCTVLAVLGASVWGYQLAVRDANGIPVVRAMSQPLRMAPETPGGNVPAHQGLAVNSIPATGTSAPSPDQVTLAPQPAEIAPQDQLLGANVLPENIAPALEMPQGATLGDPALGAVEMTDLADLADLPSALPEDMPLTDAEAVERALELALSEGGDPALAPAADAAIAPEAQEPVSMSNTDPVAPPTSEMDPSAIPVGTPMVQFGAYDNPETARAEWAMLQTRFTELMAGKALVVEPAKSGGRDFFRLRAYGFDSADDTRRFCSAILAENGTCLTVDQR
jgi:hypothetical protein